ncbi:nitrophenyl compound nitroreductase subunit ArsF family protein [Bacteroidota bacterium]
MKFKAIILLLIMLIMSSAYLSNGVAKEPDKVKNYVKVVYFHGDFRCATCTKLQSYSEEVLKKYFPEDIKNGKIIWSAINFDKDKNKHYLDDFQLYNKALILIKYKNGKQVEWKNCTKIWEYVSDKSEYYKYVKKEVNEYLKDM